MSRLHYETLTPLVTQDVTAVTPYLAMLMLRNVATDGWVFVDPIDPGRRSQPGCIIASPSFPGEAPDVDQNYVYNWTRDAALVALEIATGTDPVLSIGAVQHLTDWLGFAADCQTNGTGPLDRGSWRIDATARDWSDQADGPALRIVAALAALPLLDPDGRDSAGKVIGRDLDFLITAYTGSTTDLWEEKVGHSIFTRSVQLRAFRALADTPYAPPHNSDIDRAIEWLQTALDQHWDAAAGLYRCLLDAGDVGDRDPAVDVILAAVVGALDPWDPRLLATAAKIRAQWADPASPVAYPVNAEDATRGIGPLVGRYPDDRYDGDMTDSQTSLGHPWALCTAAFATLYYRVAANPERLTALAADRLAGPFFAQAGVQAEASAAQMASRLRDAGDRMLQAVLFHSDHLELSEQFDAHTGYEKSVRNLTWSYAAYLAALRAR
jgi:glucoamylase